MADPRRGESPDQPAEGDRDVIDEALEEAPAKGVIDESDPDPPEPQEPG